MIDVSGLGMHVVVTGDVLYANLFGEPAELLPSPVVEQQDPHLFGWIADRFGGHDRGPHHVKGFVVSWHQDIHCWPIGRISGKGQWKPLQGAKSLEISK